MSGSGATLARTVIVSAAKDLAPEENR